MAQNAIVSRQSRYGRPLNAPADRLAGFLYFPLETKNVLTGFRKRVLTCIYRTALELATQNPESATVSLSSSPDEEDSLHLDLTLIIDDDWSAAQELTQKVLDRVGEWSREWSKEEQQDYGRWIYFGVIPSEL